MNIILIVPTSLVIGLTLGIGITSLAPLNTTTQMPWNLQRLRGVVVETDSPSQVMHVRLRNSAWHNTMLAVSYDDHTAWWTMDTNRVDDDTLYRVSPRSTTAEDVRAGDEVVLVRDTNTGHKTLMDVITIQKQHATN